VYLKTNNAKKTLIGKEKNTVLSSNKELFNHHTADEYIKPILGK
jgi:hypothetical protein